MVFTLLYVTLFLSLFTTEEVMSGQRDSRLELHFIFPNLKGHFTLDFHSDQHFCKVSAKLYVPLHVKT